jgi:hypothetical protein
MNTLQKLFHFHDWEYYEWVGIQGQPVKRTCLTCGKSQEWIGYRCENYHREWRAFPENWKTEQEIKDAAEIKRRRQGRLERMIKK